MDKLGAALRRVAKFLGRQRVDASAASVSRLEYGHLLACAGKLAGRHQARSAGADHHEMRKMPSGSRHQRGVIGVTPDASANLRAFGGHSLLNSGTGQHMRAMFHDAGYFAGLDAVALDPGSDGKEVWIADRVLVTHDPRTPHELMFDQLKAFRHVR